MYMITTLVGSLARDAEMRYTAQGKAMVNISIPTNYGWGDNQKTVWNSCTWFGEWAEKKYGTGKMTKGTLVTLQVEFNGIYVPENGEPSINWNVREYKVVRNSNSVVDTDVPDDEADGWDDEEDEIPF